MPALTVLQAVNDALKTEMRKNKDVVVLGEDVGTNGGVFRATEGLLAEFGSDRVMDTPLAESGIVGTAIGMALYGLKPVAEIQFQDFIYPAFDQIVSELAKMRYRSGGQYTCPVTVRAPYGGGIKGGHYHSQSAEAYFTHTPGLKVVIPSDPYDTKGLLISAIRDPDPVMFFEPKRIYRAIKGEVPEGEYTVPLGKAKVARPGKDLTLVAWGAMVHVALEAAKRAADDEIECEVLDLRTLAPLDEESLLESVKKTGRLVIVHEAPRTSGFGGELAAIVAEKALEWLEAPIARVTGFDTPFPYTLEDVYMPDADRVLRAILSTHRYVT
jgi:2-oxoisovalerate dehydrogenase E1 component beta subunit